MTGSKAVAVFDAAVAAGRAALLLDYRGCGASEGAFADATLEDWRDDVLDVVDAFTDGPLILVGSSMGGWLMLLVAEALTARDGAKRVAALVGIAAAPDFTRWGYDDAMRDAIHRNGVIYADNPYGPERTPTYLGLWQSGEANLVLDREIAIDCPVRLLHGQHDADVPWDVSLRLANALRSCDVQTLLIKDGDHRLSRDNDIAILIATVAALAR